MPSPPPASWRRTRRRCLALNLGALLAVGSAAAWTTRVGAPDISFQPVTYRDWNIQLDIPAGWESLGDAIDFTGIPLRGFSSPDGSTFLRIRHGPMTGEATAATLCCSTLGQYALFVGPGLAEACRPRRARFLDQSAARVEMSATGAGGTALSVVMVATVILEEEGTRIGVSLEMQVNGPFRRVHRRTWDRIRTSAVSLSADATGYLLRGAPGSRDD